MNEQRYGTNDHGKFNGKNKNGEGDKECCFVLFACLAILSMVVQERYYQ